MKGNSQPLENDPIPCAKKNERDHSTALSFDTCSSEPEPW